MKLPKKKTWEEKLDAPGLPKVEPMGEKQTQRWGHGTVVVPAPREVEA